MMTSQESSDKRLLPLPIIEAASKGDTEAMNVVLNHYEGYIIKLCRRKYYDDYGNTKIMLDDAMRRRLETKLITKIVSFKIL